MPPKQQQRQQQRQQKKKDPIDDDDDVSLTQFGIPSGALQYFMTRQQQRGGGGRQGNTRPQNPAPSPSPSSSPSPLLPSFTRLLTLIEHPHGSSIKRPDPMYRERETLAKKAQVQKLDRQIKALQLAKKDDQIKIKQSSSTQLYDVQRRRNELLNTKKKSFQQLIQELTPLQIKNLQQQIAEAKKRIKTKTMAPLKLRKLINEMKQREALLQEKKRAFINDLFLQSV